MAETDSHNVIAVAEKTCSRCGQPRPIEEYRFRDRENGVRHEHCNFCFAGYMREHRSDVRRRDLKAYVEQIATDPASPSSVGARTRTEAVLTAMLKRFGGLEGLANDWFNFLKLAKVAGKHHVIQRSFEAMLRLLELADKGDQDREDPMDGKSDEEAQESLARSVVKLIWGEPYTAVVVLEHLGWKLEPPEELPLQESIAPASAALQRQIPGLFGDEMAESCISLQ